MDQPIPSGHPLAAVLAAQERTASWLARKTGKHPSYVTYVLAGKRRPSQDFMRRSAEALSVPVALIFPERAA